MNRKSLTQGLILLFVALQAVSVLVGSIPAKAKDPLSTVARGVFLPVSTPYLTLTGQWQNWNLFSPNPEKLTVEYYVDIVKDDASIGTVEISSDTISLVRRTNILKILRQLWRDGDEYARAREQFLRSFCSRWDLDPETYLTLRVRAYDAHYSSNEDSEWADARIKCT